MIIRYRNVPAPCRFCNTVQASEVCDKCASPRPARKHPKRCPDCLGWKCTPWCSSTVVADLPPVQTTFRAVAA